MYYDGRLFGLIADDVLYLKVDDSNRADYEREGMQPFRPYRDRDEVSMSYFEIPAGVLEDQEMLAILARKSVTAANVPTSRPRRPRKDQARKRRTKR